MKEGMKPEAAIDKVFKRADRSSQIPHSAGLRGSYGNVAVAELGGPAVRRQSLWRYWRGGLQGSEFIWAVAFVVPYIAVFLLFVIYPVCYGVWMGKTRRCMPRSSLTRSTLTRWSTP